jgi:cytochrome P450
MELFSPDMLRNPFPLYEQMRAGSPVFQEPRSGLWMIFDYDDVKRALSDHEVFSSRHGPADWLTFLDPPRHGKLRALVASAFTPRSITAMETRIAQLSHQILEEAMRNGDQIDLAQDFAIPLPMRVIADLLGVPIEDRERFLRWNDSVVNMSLSVARLDAAKKALDDFVASTQEMNDYLTTMLAERKTRARDDLLTRLAGAELDGERLTQQDILGFFQLLLVAGQETTTNLINNAMLCLMEYPHVLAQLRSDMSLLPAMIEEVLRFRSPLQWMFRKTQADVEMHGKTIPSGKVVLAMIGSANRDPRYFPDPDRFDIKRDPNPHLAFGVGHHFCMGAPLARLEARIALTHLLERMRTFERTENEPWEPRKGLHVHGPARLPIRYEPIRAG